MAEITTIFLFLAGGLSARLARVVRHQERREARTREWIEFLQEDLPASTR